MRHAAPRPFVLYLLLLTLTTLEARAEGPILFSVAAGAHDREKTPVVLDLDLAALTGPLAETARHDGPALVVPIDGGGPPIPAQFEAHGPAQARLTFCLRRPLAAGQSRRYRLSLAPPDHDPAPAPVWRWSSTPEGALELTNRDRPVFRYNVSLVENPDYPPIQRRGAYLHPVHAPSGALVTGDFSRFHPHHRGFFLAYTKAHIGPTEADFWNIHAGKGKVYCERLGPAAAGPVTARFATEHRWEADGRVVLRERWDVVAYDVPESPYWLFDITSTQRAEDAPMELLPYRYGGMAYRGPDSFQPRGVLDVLTSEGLDRVRGDQKPARWVDLTGPIATGPDHYAGAMMADHPSNPGYPTIARIHPSTLPFFCWVPAHSTRAPLTIAADTPRVFRYRVMVHDGHPDPRRDEAIWRDFADPPHVTLLPDQP